MTGPGDDAASGMGGDVSLRLYVAGMSPRSVRAVQNISRVCERCLRGRYHLEVVDVMSDPARAAEDDIIALPTLVRIAPEPIRKIIGDLSDTARLLAGLELGPDPATPAPTDTPRTG